MAERSLRASIGPRARVVPLAVLLAIVAMAVIVRSRAGRPKPAPVVVASAASTASSAAPSPASNASASLGAPWSQTTARVADKTSHRLHSDAQRTHRAHGRVPNAVKLA